MYQEELAGITVVSVGAALIAQQITWRKVVALVLFGLIAVQAVLALSYTLRTEWGGRPTIVDNPKEYFRELKFLLRDRSVENFLSDSDRSRLDIVQTWFETAPKTSAFEVWLKPTTPIINARQEEFFVTRVSRREFIEKVKGLSGQGMYSLCLAEDLASAKEAIARRGLEVSSVTAFAFPFFSSRTRIGMMLIEIRVPQEPVAREQFETSWLQGAFAPADYNEEIIAIDAPATMKAGTKVALKFKVRNLGSETWPAVGTKEARYQINLGNHWIHEGVQSEDSRAVLKADLPPGGETELTFTVNVPATPGSYSLVMDMVHEGVTWFEQRGGRPLTIPITVVP
jgi:hypothetical protein